MRSFCRSWQLSSERVANRISECCSNSCQIHWKKWSISRKLTGNRTQFLKTFWQFCIYFIFTVSLFSNSPFSSDYHSAIVSSLASCTLWNFFRLIDLVTCCLRSRYFVLWKVITDWHVIHSPVNTTVWSRNWTREVSRVRSNIQV